MKLVGVNHRKVCPTRCFCFGLIPHQVKESSRNNESREDFQRDKSRASKEGLLLLNAQEVLTHSLLFSHLSRSIFHFSTSTLFFLSLFPSHLHYSSSRGRMDHFVVMNNNGVLSKAKKQQKREEIAMRNGNE